MPIGVQAPIFGFNCSFLSSWVYYSTISKGKQDSVSETDGTVGYRRGSQSLQTRFLYWSPDRTDAVLGRLVINQMAKKSERNWRWHWLPSGRELQERHRGQVSRALAHDQSSVMCGRCTYGLDLMCILYMVICVFNLNHSTNMARITQDGLAQC